jgi:hypothetical protein
VHRGFASDADIFDKDLHACSVVHSLLQATVVCCKKEEECSSAEKRECGVTQFHGLMQRNMFITFPRTKIPVYDNKTTGF